MGKRLILAVLLIALSVFLTQNIAESALYRWIDKNGQSHVTDYPPPNEEDTETASPEDTKKPEAAPPETKASPVPPVTVATPKPPKPTPPPVAAVTPQPSKPVPSASPAVAATPVPAQPSASAAPTPPRRPTTKRTMPAQMPHKAAAPVSLPVPMQTLLAIIFGLIIISYIVHVYFLYKIAAMLGVPSPWMAFIPLVNLYTMVRTAGKPLWWLAVMFVPIVNIRFAVYLWMAICERLGINKKYGLLSLVYIVGPILINVSKRFTPLILGNTRTALLINFIVIIVFVLISLLVAAALPAICYRAANKARKEDSPYMPSEASLPDYEHDTLPYNQPDYGEGAGHGEGALESSETLAGAEFPAGEDVSVYETGDDETVVIGSPNDQDAFTVEASLDRHIDTGSEAITMDPNSLDSEAFTLDGDIAEEKNIPETGGRESEISSGTHEKDDEELDFTLDDFSIDSEPEAGTSSQPEGQPEQDEDYKLEIDDLTVIKLDEDSEARVQPEIESPQEPDTSSEIEFQLELDDLPAADSDTFKPGLPQDDDAQPVGEQVSSGLDFDLEPDINMNSGDAFLAGLDNYGKTDEPMAGTAEAAETEDEGFQVELPPEFSLEIAGAPSEPSDMEIGLETGQPSYTAEQEEYDISSDLSLAIDFPTEDAAGNLKIDISEFKSLAAMVELEMEKETAGTAGQQYDISMELPSETYRAAAPGTSIQPEGPEPDVKPIRGAKSKKEPKGRAINPIPEVEAAPEVPAKPKKAAKPKKEPVHEEEAKPVVPAKPKAPPMPEKERSLEDILIDGLKLEMDEPERDDDHKEGKS